MMTKILAMGFIMHRDSYMRSPWNIMDFIVVTSALAEKSVLLLAFLCSFFTSPLPILGRAAGSRRNLLRPFLSPHFFVCVSGRPILPSAMFC